jgi:hypothetical protein
MFFVQVDTTPLPSTAATCITLAEHVGGIYYAMMTIFLTFSVLCGIANAYCIWKFYKEASATIAAARARIRKASSSAAAVAAAAPSESNSMHRHDPQSESDHAAPAAAATVTAASQSDSKSTSESPSSSKRRRRQKERVFETDLFDFSNKDVRSATRKIRVNSERAAAERKAKAAEYAETVPTMSAMFSTTPMTRVLLLNQLVILTLFIRGCDPASADGRIPLIWTTVVSATGSASALFGADEIVVMLIRILAPRQYYNPWYHHFVRLSRMCYAVFGVGFAFIRGLFPAHYYQLHICSLLFFSLGMVRLVWDTGALLYFLYMGRTKFLDRGMLRHKKSFVLQQYGQIKESIYSAIRTLVVAFSIGYVVLFSAVIFNFVNIGSVASTKLTSVSYAAPMSSKDFAVFFVIDIVQLVACVIVTTVAWRSSGTAVESTALQRISVQRLRQSSVDSAPGSRHSSRRSSRFPSFRDGSESAAIAAAAAAATAGGYNSTQVNGNTRYRMSYGTRPPSMMGSGSAFPRFSHVSFDTSRLAAGSFDMVDSMARSRATSDGVVDLSTSVQSSSMNAHKYNNGTADAVAGDLVAVPVQQARSFVRKVSPSSHNVAPGQHSESAEAEETDSEPQYVSRSRTATNMSTATVTTVFEHDEHEEQSDQHQAADTNTGAEPTTAQFNTTPSASLDRSAVRRSAWSTAFHPFARVSRRLLFGIDVVTDMLLFVSLLAVNDEFRTNGPQVAAGFVLCSILMPYIILSYVMFFAIFRKCVRIYGTHTGNDVSILNHPAVAGKHKRQSLFSSTNIAVDTSRSSVVSSDPSSYSGGSLSRRPSAVDVRMSHWAVVKHLYAKYPRFVVPFMIAYVFLCIPILICMDIVLMTYFIFDPVGHMKEPENGQSSCSNPFHSCSFKLFC